MGVHSGLDALQKVKWSLLMGSRESPSKRHQDIWPLQGPVCNHGKEYNGDVGSILQGKRVVHQRHAQRDLLELYLSIKKHQKRGGSLGDFSSPPTLYPVPDTLFLHSCWVVYTRPFTNLYPVVISPLIKYPMQ